jgi:hypothetical protein
MHVMACNDHVIACKVHACNGHHVMHVLVLVASDSESECWPGKMPVAAHAAACNYEHPGGFADVMDVT